MSDDMLTLYYAGMALGAAVGMAWGWPVAKMGLFVLAGQQRNRTAQWNAVRS
jgi:hypothetical protein